MNKRLSILSTFSPILIFLAVAVVLLPWPWWNGDGQSQTYWYLYDITRAAFIFLLSWCWFASVEWKWQRLRFILMFNSLGWTFFLLKQIFTPGVAWQSWDWVFLGLTVLALFVYCAAHTRWRYFEPYFIRSEWPKPT